jgi:tRNA nucleotidyltransferase (CCA-adding enzyme)
LNRLDCEEQVLDHIRPQKEEYDHIWSVAGRLIDAVNRSGLARGMVVGSVARNTWVRGDRDLDIFMLFDPGLPRDELARQGLDLGRRIARTYGGDIREKYAEHPYINTIIEGLFIDLVPCYAVDRATEIQSAVDRTPFHTRYVEDHIEGYMDDVLLLKQFTKTSGIYGSDHMTEGFSGYLCELLVIHYGGFTPLLEAASNWRPGTVIDIERHQGKDFLESLVVIDPVDPDRNVAAALSLTKMFEFVELCRGYLEAPGLDFFFPPQPSSLEKEEFQRIIRERKTLFYAMLFRAPDIVPDILIPQLRKTVDSIAGMLTRYGFVLNRADCSVGDTECMLLFELLVDRLPPVKKHMGPQIWDLANTARFMEKYVDEVFSGPYIEGERYYVEKERKHTSVDEILRSKSPLKLSLGKHVKQVMEEGWRLVRDDEIWVEDFIHFISEFLQRRSPLMRIKHEQAKKQE